MFCAFIRRLFGVDGILERFNAMATKLDDEIARLKAATTTLTNASDSAEALLGGLKKMLDDALAAAAAAGATEEQLADIRAVVDKMETEAAELAAATAANTPAAPQP
jgi:hypothetical protein